MALDKLVNSSQLDGALTSTANAIRAKTGETDSLTWDMDTGFSVPIGDIVTLDEGTADADATSADILAGKSAYVDGQKVEGSILAKASATYNTSSSDQEIASGQYLSGKQTIKAVTTTNIDAANIKDGVNVKVGDVNNVNRIKNVTGTFTSASTVSSGQTAAVASDIKTGKSAWVDGTEVKGSLGNTSVTQGTSTKSGTTVTRGVASWGTGVISSGSIGAATFANEATSGQTYLDISDTEDSPVLVSGDNLYINKGYTDNLKISLAKLVPDGSDVKGHGEYILSGHSAYDDDGTLVAGTIQSQAAQTIYPKSSDQTIASGKYLSGKQTIKAVTTSGISAGNIKHGQTIKVGDSADDDRITAVTGTFTKASTVSSGQAAATASQMLSGYSAWVDGAEVKGNIATKTSSDMTVSGKTVTAPAGYYAESQSKDVASATPAFDGGDLSGGSTAEFTHLTTSSTNNGIIVQTKYTAARTAVLYNGAVNGWVNKADNTEALAAQSKSSTNGTAYYVTGVRVPDYASFDIEADSAASIDSSKAISVNLQQYRQLNVNSSPNTLVNVTNSGNTIATVSTRNGFPAGNVSVVARGNSYEFEEAQTVATDGYWVQPTVNAAGTYYGKVTVGSADPVFDGGDLSGNSTAEFTNITTSSSNNGIKIQTKYSASSTDVLYNGVISGWVTKDDNAQALAGKTLSSTNGKAYYVTGVTVPKDKSFSVTTTADTALDDTSNLSVVNNAYRNVNITNKANGSISIISNIGDVSIVGKSSTEGNVSIKAYNASGTLDSNTHAIVTNGKWVTPTVNADGTYYGKVTVGSAEPAFDGGNLSGNSTAVGTNVSINTTNDNGIEIQTKYTASSADVLYNGAVNGWVSKADNAQALAGKSLPSTNGTKYYISAITQPKDQVFRVTTEADTVLDTSSDLTVINNAYRRVNVTNNANATILVSSNKGEVNIFTPDNDAGKVIVDAYYNDTNKSGSATIVTNGKWKQNNVTGPGTYYGRTTVGSGNVSTSFGNTNLWSYFTAGTSEDNDASIIPWHSATAGYVSAASHINGNTTYLKVISGSTTQNAPTVNSSGLVTATSTVTAGYQAADTKSNTLQLSTQAGKTVTPTESEQTAVASGKYTTGAIKVAAISSTYVGSAIAQNDSDDLTADGATVTAPAGYYAEDATKTIASGSVTQNAPTIDSSTGVVTATATVTAGYVGADTKSNTLSLTTKAATTFNTSTSTQSIAAGTYLTGKQTIRPVTTSGIDAANIKDGAVIKVGDAGSATRIKNVTGTFTDASTVSSGQTAAAAAQIRSGYSAWVDGAEVKGSLGDTSVSQGTTTVSGTTANRGTATWGTGVISSGSINAATFANTATSGTTYVDISNTTDAPVLVSGSSLFINKGYVDNLKISLAKLVPDGASADLASNKILSGYSAYNNDGVLVAGSIASQAAQTITPTTTNQTIASGKYLSGAQTIVGDANLKPENIKTGTSIFGVLGTYAGTVPVITETGDSHGGTVVNISTDKVYDWRGVGIEFVQNATSYDVALADTDFATWTPSTTAKTIRATANSGTFVADMANYEYFVEWKVWIDVVYNSGATLKSTPKTQVIYVYNPIYRRPTSIADAVAHICNYNASSTYIAGLLEYYTSTGASGTYFTTSYGLYGGATASTVSDTAVDNPTVTLKCPTLIARCNGTYFATARAAEIDQTNSIYHIRGKVYRCNPGAFGHGLWGEAVVNLYNERGEL